jgi:hypothetical protein
MDFPRDLDEQRKVMYEAQLRTNELLEQLIQLQANKTAVEPKPPVNRVPQTNKTTTRRKAK